MREKFFSGLILLFPLAITFWFLKKIVLFLTEPFQGVVSSILHACQFFPYGFLFFSHVECVEYVATLVILLMLVIGMTTLGFLAQKYVSATFFKLLDEFFLNIPLISRVYKLCRKLTDALLADKAVPMAHVGLAPFISPIDQSVYIITNKVVLHHEETYAVTLLPTALNPTIGILLLIPEKSLAYKPECSVEEAVRFVISCGVTELSEKHKSL